jgi:selenide,water dikinase
MRRLNRAAADVLVEAAVRGATDVTGFGLLGHALEMARASATRFVFEADALPVLPGALALAADGVETGGAGHNRRFVAGSLTVASGVADELVALAHDPQTSGGLLAAIPAEHAAKVEAALDEAKLEHWWIGEVTEGDGSRDGGAIELR